MSPWLSKFPQDITFSPVGSFLPSFHMFVSAAKFTLLIETSTANFTLSQLLTNVCDILTSHIHANGLEGLILQISANVLAHLKSPNIFMTMWCINKGL
jgi:hypothetical protein